MVWLERAISASSPRPQKAARSKTRTRLISLVLVNRVNRSTQKPRRPVCRAGLAKVSIAMIACLNAKRELVVLSLRVEIAKIR